MPTGKPKTSWNSSDIWVRRTFDVSEIPRALRWLVFHDEDVEVYLNGEMVWSETAHLSDYKEVELALQALAALRVGRNVLSIHCQQTAGEQLLDVGLSASAGKAPEAGRDHHLLLDRPK